MLRDVTECLRKQCRDWMFISITLNPVKRNQPREEIQEASGSRALHKASEPGLTRSGMRDRGEGH